MAGKKLRERLPVAYKGVYPFRLGTTSFIYPDHYAPNVERVGPYLDEIELLMFESLGPDSLPSSREIETLAGLSRDLSITYNVHLPTDVPLGDPDRSKRRTAVAAVKKVMDLTAVLAPTTCTLHLEYDRPSRDAASISEWQRCMRAGVGDLIGTGVPAGSLSIETLDYPFEWVEPILQAFDLSVCLDLGHLMIYGYDPEAAFARYGDRTAIIHLHGVENGRDHIALDRLSPERTAAVMRILRRFRGTVSLEVFNFENLKRSLAFLDAQWNEAPSLTPRPSAP